jgi:hypothetical protein
VIYPYSPAKQKLYLFSSTSNSTPSPLTGTSTPRDPSIYFTIARILIAESFNLFPMCTDPSLIQDRPSYGLPGLFYYHPHILRIL